MANKKAKKKTAARAAVAPADKATMVVTLYDGTRELGFSPNPVRDSSSTGLQPQPAN